MEDGDDRLLARVARGDAVAFSNLVARHRAKLIAVTARIVGNRAIAEEVVQEVFTRAWVNAPRWKPRSERGASYKSWLMRVATNLAIDHARRQKTVPLEDVADPVDAQPRADANLVAEEDRKRLEMALALLPARQRAAIALAYDEDLSNAEGAAAMEISVGAFELLLVRARRALRKAMMEAQ